MFPDIKIYNVAAINIPIVKKLLIFLYFISWAAQVKDQTSTIVIVNKCIIKRSLSFKFNIIIKSIDVFSSVNIVIILFD